VAFQLFSGSFSVASVFLSFLTGPFLKISVAFLLDFFSSVLSFLLDLFQTLPFFSVEFERLADTDVFSFQEDVLLIRLVSPHLQLLLSFCVLWLRILLKAVGQSLAYTVFQCTGLWRNFTA